MVVSIYIYIYDGDILLHATITRCNDVFSCVLLRDAHVCMANISNKSRAYKMKTASVFYNIYFWMHTTCNTLYARVHVHSIYYYTSTDNLFALISLNFKFVQSKIII